MHRPAGPVTADLGHRLNLVATILMSVAALATSWAGYQASVWNGNQAAHGGRSTALRTTSTRMATRAGQARIVDVQLFTSWLTAYAQHNAPLAGFYEQRFRPEFAPAFRAWIASRPRYNPNAASSPFALPEYRLADDADAERLGLAADKESAASQHANAVSDSYVFDAVILATVMFFAGTAQNGPATRMRMVLVGIALAMCAAGIYRLVTSPLA